MNYRNSSCSDTSPSSRRAWTVGIEVRLMLTGGTEVASDISKVIKEVVESKKEITDDDLL